MEVAPLTPSYRTPAWGYRLGTGLGLTLGGVGIATVGLGTAAAVHGSGITAAVFWLGGVAILGSGALVTNLSAIGQAHNVGARKHLAKAGLILAAAGIGCALLSGVPVLALASPVLLGVSLLQGALQGGRNLGHARALRVGVVPRLYPGGGVGLGIAGSF